MKKIFHILITVLMLSTLCGCSQKKIIAGTYGLGDTLNNEIYIVSAYTDEEGNTIKCGSKIEAWIENYDGETFYEGTIKSSKSDAFEYNGYYFCQANVPMDEIKEGTAPNGTLYYRIKTDGVEQSGIYQEELIGILPTKPVIIEYDELPCELETVSIVTGEVTEIVRIDEISYEKDAEYDWYNLTVKGTKLKGKDNWSYTYECLVYDTEGNLVEEEDGIVTSISAGDTFTDEVSLFSLDPGQTYKLVIQAYTFKWPAY